MSSQMAMNHARSWKAVVKRAVPAGALLAAALAVAQYLAGCAGTQFPAMQATDFNVTSTFGEIRWVTNSTASVGNFVVGGITGAQVQVTNVQGPPLWLEALLVYSATPGGDATAVPIKQHSVSGLTLTVGDVFGAVDATRPTAFGPNYAMPPNTTITTGVTVLWKNSLNQSNFTAGEFDSLCFCYARVPALRMNGAETVPPTEKVTLGFNVKYELQSGGSGG